MGKKDEQAIRADLLRNITSCSYGSIQHACIMMYYPILDSYIKYIYRIGSFNDIKFRVKIMIQYVVFFSLQTKDILN